MNFSPLFIDYISKPRVNQMNKNNDLIPVPQIRNGQIVGYSHEHLGKTENQTELNLIQEEFLFPVKENGEVVLKKTKISFSY